MGEGEKQFELDPQSYAALVDWPKRLANETPFYRRRLTAIGARRALDVACGTGHHASLLHSWGLEVEGADIEPAMIEYCRATHGETESLRWVVRSFVDPPGAAGWFDAAVCVGNSLALVPSVEVVRRVIAAMVAAVRPGGVCIAQVVNLWRMPEGPTNWQKCQRLRRGDEDQIVIKGMHRVGEHGHVDFIELRLRGEEFTSHLQAAKFIGLREAELLDAAADAGGRGARLWGTFQEAPYDPAASPDLILECYRA